MVSAGRPLLWWTSTVICGADRPMAARVRGLSYEDLCLKVLDMVHVG